MELVRVREDRLGRAHTGEVIAPPSRSGEPFHYALRRGGWRYYAHSAQALLSVLIRGYPPLPAGPPAVDPDQKHLVEDENSDGLGQQRLQARVRHAKGTRTWEQGELVAAAEARLGQLPDPVRTVLLANTQEPPVLEQAWTHEVPLVLVEVAYAPYSDRPCPVGNIVWLRPATADGYLRSLAAAGLILLSARP